MWQRLHMNKEETKPQFKNETAREQGKFIEGRCISTTNTTGILFLLKSTELVKKFNPQTSIGN